jgi:SET domain-containing protein
MNWIISKSSIHGIGVFSKIALTPNEYIDVAIDSNKQVTVFGSKINHSWSPTAQLIYNSVDKTYDVHSIKNIDLGNEITLDYTFTPPFIKGPLPNWN